MTCQIETKALLSALSTVGRIVKEKSVSPLFSRIFLRITDGQAIIVGSNGDTTIEHILSSDGNGDVSAVVALAPMVKFVSLAKDTLITILQEVNGVTLKSGRNRITLSVDFDDYPYSLDVSDDAPVNGEALSEAIKFCLGSASDDKTQHALSSVHINGEHVWATDSKSAHHAVIEGQDAGTATIAADDAVLMQSVLGAHDDVSMSLAKNKWTVSSEYVRAQGRVLDVVYPDIERAVNGHRTAPVIATIGASDLTGALAVASSGSSSDATKSTVILVKATNDGRIVFRGRSGSNGVNHPGRAELDVPVENELEVAVSAERVRSAVSGMGGDVVISGNGNAVMVSRGNLEAMIMGVRAHAGEFDDV